MWIETNSHLLASSDGKVQFSPANVLNFEPDLERLATHYALAKTQNLALAVLHACAADKLPPANGGAAALRSARVERPLG